MQGRLNYPLSARGIREAERLAERLKEQRFSAFFSSNLLRAVQTARIISSRGKAPPPVLLPLLQEYCWGVIQGLTGKEIEERFPSLAARLRRDFHHALIPGSEGLERLFSRVRAFYRLLDILDRRKNFSSPVLVVSHGRFLQAFIIFFLGCDPADSWPFSLSPASLTVLERDKRGRRRLVLFNDVCHLT